MASAPAAAHTRAMAAIEVTLGESLTISGRFETLLDLVHQVLERAGIGTERHAAGVHIGAGDVQLVGGDAFGIVQALDHLLVFADRIAEDVDDDFAGGIAAQGRQLLLDELGDADVLQSDGIEHARSGLDDARRGMAGHGFQRDALGDERADALQRDDLFKFDAVAEGAAGGDDRVGQLDAGELHFHVGFHARWFSSSTECLFMILGPVS